MSERGRRRSDKWVPDPRPAGSAEKAPWRRQQDRLWKAPTERRGQAAQIGAAPYDRSSERVAYRNGYRTRRWDTRVVTIELRIPKVSSGAYFSLLLSHAAEPRRVLHSVVVEAYVKGVSTRKVDDLVRALGIDADNPR